MNEEKIYTQEQMDDAINKIRIAERYMANQLMGNLGIPLQHRISPDGKEIYKEAADIVMGLVLAPPKKPDPDPGVA